MVNVKSVLLFLLLLLSLSLFLFSNNDTTDGAIVNSVSCFFFPEMGILCKLRHIKKIRNRKKMAELQDAYK